MTHPPKPASSHLANQATLAQIAHDVWGLTIEL